MASFSVAAQSGHGGSAAAPSWVPTATRAHSIPSSQAGPAAAPGEVIHVSLSLNLRNAADLASFNNQVTRPGSPAYGQFLTPTQYLQRYAPTPAQAQAVADYLTRSGFRNVQISPSRMLVTADGTAAAVQAAFNTQLTHVNVNGRDAIANTKPAQVPSSLAGIVQSVLGLQTVHMFKSMAVQNRSLGPVSAPRTPASSTQPQKLFGFNLPSDMALIYGAHNAPAAAQTPVGIIAEGDLSQTLLDLQFYERYTGTPAVPVSVVTVGVGSGDTDGLIEWDLDSQSILGMAGGRLQQLVFYAADSFFNDDITAAYDRAVMDDTVKLVNVSLGECEAFTNEDGTQAADDAIFQRAIAQGQIFSVSSGDSGSHECGDDPQLAQSYPATSPYVIAVGGTTLTDNEDVYVSESAWNGGGGGPSLFEPVAPWQRGIVPSNSGRGVPDLAFVGDPETGEIVFAFAGCGGHCAYAYVVGGTSLSSPLFVGFWARLETNNGNRLGFPGPSLYQQLPGHPNLVHDVTTGNNDDGFGDGVFSAAPGWDYTTGFGSPIVDNFNAFINPKGHGF